MHYLFYRYAVLFFSLLPLFPCILHAGEHLNSKGPYHVRVLLDTRDMNQDAWLLLAPSGFILHDRHNLEKKYAIRDQHLTIAYTSQGIICNNQVFTTDYLIIAPANKQEHIGHSGNNYQGIFLIVRSKGRLLLINRLELEDYVFSVLRTESFPGWPLEVNKVFAIACRTYALAMIMNSCKNELAYHIKNTNHHQTYTGVHTYEQLRQATKETEGIFLSYQGKPILAMFDICCGGIIPAHISGFDFVKTPYLARTYPCDFCKRSKIYEWQVSYSKQKLKALLGPEIKKIQVISDITLSKDKAGLVRTITIHGKKQKVTLTGKRFYSLVKEMRSHCFTIQKTYDDITIKGRGYGHQIGICQHGVREMVRDGYDYRSILSFYYPQTTYMRLRYA